MRVGLVGCGDIAPEHLRIGEMKLKSVSAKKIGSYPWVPFDELWVELEANKSSGCIYASFNSVRGSAFIAVCGTEGITTP